MTIDWNILSSLANTLSSILALSAFLALISQLKQGKQNISTTILREHERQFFYSEDFQAIRVRTCLFLKNNLNPQGPESLSPGDSDRDWIERTIRLRMEDGVSLSQDGWEIVDFLDSLAIYGDKGSVDKEMAFAKFFFYYDRYWALLGPWITDYRRKDGQVDYYRDIDIFLKALLRYGRRKRGLVISSPRYSRQAVIDFLDQEIGSPPAP